MTCNGARCSCIWFEKLSNDLFKDISDTFNKGYLWHCNYDM